MSAVQSGVTGHDPRLVRAHLFCLGMEGLIPRGSYCVRLERSADLAFLPLLGRRHGVCVLEYHGRPWPLAMHGGWGEPGTKFVDDSHLEMVNSFAEVVGGSQPLNLQMFHRCDSDKAAPLPVIPERLTWPLPTLFAAGTEQDRYPDHPDRFGVIMDMATRVSAATAFTWWHLDDCGEFTYQVCLFDASHSSNSHGGFL